MTPANYNITLDQRCTWSRTFQFYSDTDKTTPVDLTGYTFDAELRTAIGGTLVETANITVTSASDGKITMTFSSGETAALTSGATGYWDLLATASGTTTKWIYGEWTVEGTVTQ